MLMTAFNFSTVDYRPPTITGPGGMQSQLSLLWGIR